jgi:hypothetical protein
MNFASAGQGSATHLNAEKFKLAAKIEAQNIPFKGSAEAVTEVAAGRVDYYFSPIAPVIGQIRNGQLVPLAVGSPKRASRPAPGADHRRSRRARLRVQLLDRHVRAGQDAEGDRRPPAAEVVKALPRPR